MKNTFSIGDYIIDFENIYQIYDQKIQKDYQKHDRQYFFYKVIDNNSHRLDSVTCSVPIENIVKNGLRHLMTTTEIEEFYKDFKRVEPANVVFDPKTVKEILYQNDSIKTLSILRLLHLNKIETGDSFTKSNRELYESIIEHLVREISFVTKTPAKTVQNKITSLLKAAA